MSLMTIVDKMDGNTPLFGLNIWHSGACSYRGGRLLIVFLSFFFFPFFTSFGIPTWWVIGSDTLKISFSFVLTLPLDSFLSFPFFSPRKNKKHFTDGL